MVFGFTSVNWCSVFSRYSLFANTLTYALEYVWMGITMDDSYARDANALNLGVVLGGYLHVYAVLFFIVMVFFCNTIMQIVGDLLSVESLVYCFNNHPHGVTFLAILWVDCFTILWDSMALP